MPDLLNWLWQGCLIALATGLTLRLLQRLRARDRYILCWVAMLLVLALPILPGLWIHTPSPHPDAATSVGAVLSMPRTWQISGTALIALWALWSIVQGMRVAGALLALRHARDRCLPFPEIVESRLHHWAAVRLRGRRIRLRTSSSVRSAAVFGCGSPIIVVSPALLRHLSADDVDRVVIHEWAHVQRRDDLMNLAHLAVKVIAGWHPAIRWIDRQLQIERESACDEIAVSVTRCPKAYAASLTAIAGLPRGRLWLPLPTIGVLAWSGFGNRVRRILYQKQLASSAWSRNSAAGAVLWLFAASLVIAGVRIVGTAAVPSEGIAPPVVDLQPDAHLTFETHRSDTPPMNHSRARTPVSRRPRAADRTVATREPLAASSGTAAVDAMPQQVTTESIPATGPRSASALLTSRGSAPNPGSVARGDLAPYAARPERGQGSHSEPHNGPNAPSLTPILDVPSHHVSAKPLPSPQSESPWSAAADAGVVISKRSQHAAVATGGFFSRFGKKIAASF